MYAVKKGQGRLAVGRNETRKPKFRSSKFPPRNLSNPTMPSSDDDYMEDPGNNSDSDASFNQLVEGNASCSVELAVAPPEVQIKRVTRYVRP